MADTCRNANNQTPKQFVLNTYPDAKLIDMRKEKRARANYDACPFFVMRGPHHVLYSSGSSTPRFAWLMAASELGFKRK